jgi:uncharacterized protein YndB with AHSA1/START domain
MPDAPVVHSTFTIERRYPAPPGRVFAAFADGALKRRWYADGGGHAVEAFAHDFRPGGIETLAYRLGAATPFPGTPIETEERYLDIVPGSRIVSSSAMRFAGQPVSVLLITVEIAAADAGSAMTCTIQGAFFEGSGGPEMREHGWNVLLDRLGDTLA